uniref:Uncharacterized protein n=2 Tax=Oryza sativa subsp. japonica TaxID=39947 RepID=Q8LHI6_ORYSJ|nr:hypothetical protein [Oryza sativa Japonica Group]BAD30165.1 hypothetical protein [Oryza sativa Japonica Group]
MSMTTSSPSPPLFLSSPILPFEEHGWPWRSWVSPMTASSSSTDRPHLLDDGQWGGGTASRARPAVGREGAWRSPGHSYPRELTVVECGLELKVVIELPIHGLGDAAIDAHLLFADSCSFPMPCYRHTT